MSNCPKCGQVLASVTLDDVAIQGWRGVAYSCPFCRSALSIAIDPVALKSDTVAGVAEHLETLRKHLADLQGQVAQIAHLLARR